MCFARRRTDGAVIKRIVFLDVFTTNAIITSPETRNTRRYGGGREGMMLQQDEETGAVYC